jgi:hypothetical protein
MCYRTDDTFREIATTGFSRPVEPALQKAMLIKDLQNRTRRTTKWHRHCVSWKDSHGDKAGQRNNDAKQCWGLPAILEGQAEGSRHFHCASQKRSRRCTL